MLFAILALSLSIQVLAHDDVKIETKVLRALNCTGVAPNVNGSDIAIAAKITDTKYSEITEDDVFDEYTSTVEITDVTNPSRQLFGTLVSTSSDEDTDKLRDEPRDSSGAGVVYYDLYENTEDVNGKPGRVGLLIVGSSCTAEEKSASCGGQRNYILNYGYGTDITQNPLYGATLSCKPQRRK
jgi:hypothetical protein